MDLKIRLFATLKDRAKTGQITVSLAEEADVETLLMVVGKAYPALAPALPMVLVAVNKAYAGSDTKLMPGDEVALFPPVSGGRLPHPTYFAITEAEVDLNDLHQRLLEPEVGAVITFTGAVRGHTDRPGLPPETSYLEYEAYSEMATERMVQIAHEIWEKWPQVRGIAIVQRVGKLSIGDTTTIVACAAAHRDQGAFEAARYGIDRLKQIVPVWKKEVDRNRSVWVEGDYRPTEADNR
jgi:molybdopterin converting factor subunit 1